VRGGDLGVIGCGMGFKVEKSTEVDSGRSCVGTQRVGEGKQCSTQVIATQSIEKGK
jgi:hypothetical protein